MQNTSWEMLVWMKHKLESRLLAEISITYFRYTNDPTLMAENEEELKSLLMKVKEENEKVGLNSTFRKLRSWHLVPSLHGKQMGKQWKLVDFIFRDSKITADHDCSHEIKRCLLLGRKVMTNLDRILKSRDITLPTKVHLVKAMVFPVVTYGCESWTLKKGECLLNCGVGEDSWESLGLQGDPTCPS